MKKTIIAVIVLVLVGVGVYFWVTGSKKPATTQNEQQTAQSGVNVNSQTNTSSENQPQTNPAEEVIGRSVENREITAYHFGTGDKEILLIAGIHGGYEWNTVQLGYEVVDYLKANPSTVPANVKVTVVPVLNPDGLQKTVGSPGRFEVTSVPTIQSQLVAGRFNANNVDLNRNFDCDWKASGVWQNKTVSGGSKAFSEPETQAVRAYVEANKPAAVVAFYSAAGGVYSSSCHNGVSAETTAILNKFAAASKYPAHKDFDFYSITGDMVNWLAKMGTPAISVLLTNHSDTEWTKNWAGIEALIKHYAAK